jgi:hypothetical protein
MPSALITGYAGYGWSIGFLAGFGGIVLHLLGKKFLSSRTSSVF